MCLLIPENPESIREEQEMDRLEERFLLHPALALEQSRQVTDAMARRAMDNLLRAMELVHKFSDKGCRAVEDAENAIDRYEDRLGTYLMKITGKELSQRQSEEVSKYLHTISDFERISDHALNICDAAREINAKAWCSPRRPSGSCGPWSRPSPRFCTWPSGPSSPATWRPPPGWSRWRRSWTACATR